MQQSAENIAYGLPESGVHWQQHHIYALRMRPFAQDSCFTIPEEGFRYDMHAS